MPRILIIEDDPAIVKAVEKTLTMSPGFSLEWVSDPDKAVSEAASRKPDLVLLDVRLPGGDGRVILQSLRENSATRALPVILLTGLANEGDKVLGLNLGADDYVVKPFGALELMARITAVLRRSGPGAAAESKAEVDGLSLDAGERATLVDGKPVRLQPREFDVLFLLVSHAGKTLTRDFLIQHTTGFGAPVPTRSLDTHIKNLRKKLGAKGGKIVTVPKLGYRLDP